MSFEDDAYWESEYTDRSTARSAVSRRPDAPDGPVDELAVRRKRRQGRYRRPPRPDGSVQKGFDTERPGWLDDPGFVPTDVSAPDAGHDLAVLDFNRPELGGAFDAPAAGRWTGPDVPHGVPDVVPRVAPRVEDDDWDDEIDEPYDHRAGMDRRSTVRGLNGYVPSPEDWDDPSPEDWDDADADEPAAGLDDPLDLYRRVAPQEPPGGQGGPRVVGRATPPAPRIVSQAGPPPLPARIDPQPAPRVLSGPARVAATSSPAVGTAPVSPPAVGTAPVSPASAAAPVSAPVRAPAPAPRAPADAPVTPADEPSGWFAPNPREPAAPESIEGQETTPVPSLAPDDLRAVRWRLDGATLREVVDDPDALRELGSRLDGPLAEETDHVARAGLLCLRAEVYRLLGELGMAAAASRLALAHAESARDVHAVVIAQAELAHVLRLRGHHAEADRLLEEAAGSEAPELMRSVVHEYAGRSCFDQGRHMEALNHFARAIRLGAPDDLDLVERIDVCLEAVYIHVLRDGWGPYPRRRREILSA
jgi:hypothetical protein